MLLSAGKGGSRAFVGNQQSILAFFLFFLDLCIYFKASVILFTHIQCFVENSIAPQFLLGHKTAGIKGMVEEKHLLLPI